MGDILACRVCLITDVKLFNMYNSDLITSYENVIGSQMSEGLPHQLCSICRSLLVKFATFQEKCYNTQHILNIAVLEQVKLTTTYVKSIDRVLYKLESPYSISKPELLHIDNDSETVEYEIKPEAETFIEDEGDNKSNIVKAEGIELHEEYNDEYMADDINASSDEEPLAKKVRKSRKRKKNNDKGHKLKEGNTNEDIKEETSAIDKNNEESNDNNTNVDSIDLIEDVDEITLTKQEQIDELELRKSSQNYIYSVFKCEKCYKGFMTDATYKNHMVRHDVSSGDHECDVCRCRFECARRLRTHVYTAHEKKFICKRCGHVAKSKHNALQHRRWHDGFVYKCEICGALFSKSTSHLTHVRLRHPSRHACEDCGQTFLGRFGLGMHRRRAHRAVETTTPQPEYKCGPCGFVFREEAALSAHLAAGCNETVSWCVFCGFGAASPAALRDHLKTHRGAEANVTCRECNRQFASSRTYAVHLKSAHGGRARGPNGPSGPSSPRPRARQLVCEVCGWKCKSATTLRLHQLVHATGEKPFACGECPKRFGLAQRLKAHMRTHTGERPFRCPRCPKAFKQKAALNRHDRVHSGAKPYACSYCGKTFSQSNSMKTHEKTVHLKLPAPYRHAKRKADE